MALTNGNPEVGDSILVARGALVLLVIRPIDVNFGLKNHESKRKTKLSGFHLKSYNSKGDIKISFKFVGGAYVDCIMSGEYLEEQRKHNPDGDRVRLI